MIAQPVTSIATPQPNEPARIVLTVEEAAERLGIGRTTMYALITSGDVKSVSIGRLRRVPVDALHDYVSGLMAGPSQMAA